MCMPFTVPDETDYHLVAVTPEIDNAQVVHHIMLLGCDVSKYELTRRHGLLDINHIMILRCDVSKYELTCRH